MKSINVCTGIITFPSPYGVSFILILNTKDFINTKYSKSFRLLMEYHSFLLHYSGYLSNSVDKKV